MDTWALKREAQIPKWQERIQACRSSGQAVEKWCRENGVSSKTYYRWEKYCLQMINNAFPFTVSFANTTATSTFQLIAETEGSHTSVTKTGNAAGNTVNGTAISANE